MIAHPWWGTPSPYLSGTLLGQPPRDQASKGDCTELRRQYRTVRVLGLTGLGKLASVGDPTGPQPHSPAELPEQITGFCQQI